MAEDKPDPIPTDPELEEAFEEEFLGGRRRILQRLAKRLQNPRELGGDAMELVGALLETSDRAKTEMVRMVAREVRHYLEELRLKEDLHHLLTSHSLEVKMSLSLKPLAGKGGGATGDDTAPGEPGRAAREEDAPSRG